MVLLLAQSQRLQCVPVMDQELILPAYLYGSHVGEGSLTQFISGVFNDNVHKYVSPLETLSLTLKHYS